MNRNRDDEMRNEGGRWEPRMNREEWSDRRDYDVDQRYGQDVGRYSVNERDRFGGQRDYIVRDAGQRDFSQRDFGQRDIGQRLYSQRPMGRGPKNFHRSDERIKEDLCERLWQHDWVDASEVEIQVVSGEVTLTGTVDDRQTKHLIEDIAESLLGVKDVHNQIRVDREPREMQTQQQAPRTQRPGKAQS